MLRKIGVTRIYEVADGVAALEMIATSMELPAVIIIDLNMPRMDGIELIHCLWEQYYRPALIIASAADAKLISTVEAMVTALNFPMLGTVQKPIMGSNLEDMLHRFDTAYKPKVATPANDIRITADDLKQAIIAGDIVPYYQPKVSLQSSSVVSCEALGRWLHPQHGFIPPSQFIPIAEDHGLIEMLTLHMLECVLDDMDSWLGQDLHMPVAINISMKLLSDRNIANQLIYRVERRNFQPENLILEITESALMSNIANSLACISRLRLKGFRLSIDDYGTGFSSMQQLSRIPFTELKIDKSFVTKAHNTDHLRTILQSALDMGSMLGLTTIAEGVETVEELELLKAMGCKEIQGYLFAKPMPSIELNGWLDDNSQKVKALCLGESVTC
jgi:EAL domain-containing protein (putative c-di-GMP-specific phosphodiesterase class I)